MLQQTTIAAVIPYFLKFIEKWPDVRSLATAPPEEILKEWAGLGYYARARNLHKCAGIVAAEHHGRFPADVAALRALPGIGDYTAGAIAAIAFNIPAMALDGNAERVFARCLDISEPFPAGKKAVRAAALPVFESARDGRAGDFVQAVMDLGSTVCTPKNPACATCPLAAACRGRRAGHAASLPARAKAAEKPRRFGTVYLIRDDSGHILAERRPQKGLLGGMVGLPTSDWREEGGTSPDIEDRTPDWLHEAGVLWEEDDEKHRVFHTFTHFHLELAVRFGALRAGNDAVPLPPGIFRIVISEESGAAMPSVFRKVLRLARRGS